MTDLGRELSQDDFKNRIGKTFVVQAAGQNVPLVLRAFQALPGSKRAGGGFRLEFSGPLSPLLGQGLFTFHIDRDQLGIFIVPIAETERSRRYEAVFY